VIYESIDVLKSGRFFRKSTDFNEDENVKLVKEIINDCNFRSIDKNLRRNFNKDLFKPRFKISIANCISTLKRR
jgi:thymidine kinase